MVKASEIDGLKLEAIDYLKGELDSLFGDGFEVRVVAGPMGGKSLVVHVYENVSSGVAVTWHNAKVYAMLIMHLTDGFGRVVDLQKVSFEQNGVRGMKFRKISDATIMGASKKLVRWFGKNREGFNV